MKKSIALILIVAILMIGSYGVGASTTVPASWVAYENGSTTTTVKDSLDDLISKTKVGTATAAQILSGQTALVQGATVTGTMANKGAVTATINAGGSYTIPAGYHNGSGKITASTLASQTSATATAEQILSGKTAYVNGTKLTGTMTNRGAVTSTLNAGGSYTIPAGYHSGSGKITANSLASQTSATATAADISSGKTAYVNGSKITGTNDGGYKLYTIPSTVATVTSTGTLNAFSHGTWKAIAKKGTITTFSVDLGFNPTSVVACDIHLRGNYSSSSETATDENFRTSRGYSSGTTTAAYWYWGSLAASLVSNGPCTTATSSNYSCYNLWCTVSGSTVNFKVRNEYDGTAGGTSPATRADTFYLSGTIIYK